MKLFMVLQMFLLFGHHYGNAFQNIPDAPMLPDLDYKGLPDFIRSMLPEKRASVSGNAITEDKKQIEKSRPKTYGMSLSGDSGVIWNDLVAPKSRYQIGNSRSLPAQDLDDIIDNMIDQIVSHSSTSRPDDIFTTTDHYTKSTEPIYTTEKPTTKYIGTTKSTTPTAPKVNLARTTSKPKTEKELLKEIEEKLDNIMTDAAQYIKFPNVNKISEDAKDKPSDNDENSQEKTAVDEGKDAADIKDTNPERKGNKTQKPVTLQNILELLLQNDEIWSWLNKNIAKYLEILMNRMEAVVREEVKLLLQTHFENNPSACSQTNTTDTENTKTPDLDKEDAHIENDKKDNKSPNDTAEELPKHHKEKPSESGKPEKKDKCEKNIIYGNSVGNERVTNVFIFNMNSEDKPIIHYNNDSQTIDFNNPSNVNEDTPTTTENSEKDSEITTEKYTDSNITEGPEANDDVTNATEEPETNDDVTDVTKEPETNNDVTDVTEGVETGDDVTDVTDVTEEPETNDDGADAAEDTAIDTTEQSEGSSEDSNSDRDGDENSNDTATESENVDDETENMSEAN